LERWIRSGARRSRRFSWFCWLFVFAIFLGYALATVIGVLFPVVVTTQLGNGVETSSTFPWWTYPLSFSPAVVLLALAVREVLVGRSELRNGSAPSTFRKRKLAHVAEDPGWTGTVQRCQKMVTHAKNEVEFSFVPLVLGLFSLVEFVALFVLSGLSLAGGAYWILAGPAIALPALALLWPLYRAAKGWIASYQRLLDHHVGELARLEAEFLWRFAGAGSPG
jgi:hypothetical protein